MFEIGGFEGEKQVTLGTLSNDTRNWTAFSKQTMSLWMSVRKTWYDMEVYFEVSPENELTASGETKIKFHQRC